MNFHYVQHVPFENLACIEHWAKEKGYTITSSKMYADDSFPSIGELDWVVIMGGPMGVYDDVQYPWLKKEKNFIEQAIHHGKRVLGICLGAQLIAHVLGAKVYANSYKEIGWFPVSLTDSGKNAKLFHQFPPTFTIFQWHGDTFDLPAGCEHSAYSDACVNQAFTYNENTVALQFHLESTQQSIEQLLIHCGHECEEGGEYIQLPVEIRSQKQFILENNRLLCLLLNQLENAGSTNY